MKDPEFDTKRRRFLKLAGAAAGTTLAGRSAHAMQACTGFNFNGVRACEAGIDSRIAAQSINSRQFKSQWCWAACISMLFDYYGHSVSQAHIVERVFGSSLVDAPAYPNQIMAAVNVPWEDDDGDVFYPQGEQVMGYDRDQNTILASQLLATDTPIIIGSLGHATVLTAMSWVEDVYGRYIIQSLTVRDPMRGRRSYTLNEASFAHFMAVISV